MSMHKVILVRHAKAAATSPGTDEKRPLSAAGREQARALGAKLRSEIHQLDEVFVSPALRAQQTWEEMAQGAGLPEGVPPHVHTEDIIYDGSSPQILDLVRGKSKGYASMVVGHEPTISSTAVLAVVEGEAGEVEWGMSTGSAAIVEYDGDWGKWKDHVATLATFVHVSHK